MIDLSFNSIHKLIRFYDWRKYHETKSSHYYFHYHYYFDYLFFLYFYTTFAKQSSAADKTKNTQAKVAIDPHQFADPKTVSEKYVAPILNYGKMSTYNWESPNQILADDLINICMSNNYLNLPTSPDNKPIQEYGEYLTDHVPAEDMEAAIQTYFPVTSAHLKISQYYDSKTNTYQIKKIPLRHGRGRGISAKSAVVSQNQVAIQICVSNPSRDVGTLAMELLPDGHLVYSSLLLDELELCNRKYIQNTLCSDLLFSNWESADQISSHDLTIFYLENNMDAPVLSRDEEMWPNQLPEKVESYIKQYFDVSTEQIRKSRHFDQENQVYHIWGIGSVLTSRVTAVKTEGKFLTIDYQLYREGGTPEDTELLWKGTVTIEQKNDGEFFYRSCFGEEI